MIVPFSTIALRSAVAERTCFAMIWVGEGITSWKLFSTGPSLLMPMRAKGCSARRFTSVFSCGSIARQGPHQNPQKSSTTTFPR